MNEPKVSVVIPVYNVARWLEEGIKYILAQTFSDFEVIFVNDGSTDNSGAVCEQLATTDRRIRVVHTENFGSGHARNVGIAEAKGSYIYFFDIDDDCSPLLLEKCYNRIIADESDMLVFSFDMIERGRFNSCVPHNVPDGLVNDIDDIRDFYIKYILNAPGGNGFVWNKFYRKDFLTSHGITFPDLRIQQDEVFNLRVYSHLPKISTLADPLYNYYIYSTGNTRSHYIANRQQIYLDVYNALEDFHDRLAINTPATKAKNLRRLIQFIIVTLQYNLLHPENPLSHSQKKAELKKIMRLSAVLESCHKCKLPFESRVTITIAKTGSLTLLKAFTYVMSVARKLYHRL